MGCFLWPRAVMCNLGANPSPSGGVFRRVHKWTRLRKAVVLTTTVLAAACTGNVGNQPTVSRPGSPSPSLSPPKESRHCQPFPDRLIDEFLAAYNGRDLEGLQSLVTAPEIVDVVAAAYTGGSSFEGVTEWARASWDANDRIDNSGYAFHPSKNRFQMLVTRASAVLRADGIERVSTALDAISDGCTITSLASSGPVQSKHDPCAFYDAFRSVADIASDRPRACADGSGDHARTGSIAVLGNGRILIWGGQRGGHFTYGDVAMDGLSFDSVTGRWTRIPPPHSPAFRPEGGTWTGRELIVLGSKSRPDYRVMAAAYDPHTRAWRTIKFPYRRDSGFETAWTGRELLLWGGPSHSEHPSRRGLLYNPVTDAWRKTSPAPVSARWSHAAVWTGTELIVWGGGNAHVELADGAAYNPVTDAWRELAPAPLSARQWLPLVWTGREVIVWGGSSISRSVADGAAYDPATDSWRNLSKSPLRGRHYHSAVWTGSEMIVFGGYSYHRSFADGAAYDPARDRWRRLPRPSIKPRFEHSAIWTGNEMIVFGGTWDFGHIGLGDGAAYDPISNSWRRLVPAVGVD